MSAAVTTTHVRTVDGADQAFAGVLTDLNNTTAIVTAGLSKSVGSCRHTREITNYLFTIEHPRSRIVHNPVRALSPALSVARFLWLMAGSNHLEDILPYDAGARRFSDDGRTIPGSSFGHRIMKADGFNQLDSAASLLRNDPSTRRAMLAIYQPSDCGRDSYDIPCLSSLAYQIRGHALHATHIFRSNNAYLLLPHNLFELSLLAEVLATELGVPLGTVTHFVVSMHLYESDRGSACKAVQAHGFAVPPPMETMPATPPPRAEIEEILCLQEELRRHTGAGSCDWHRLVDNATRIGTEYWRQFYYVLLLERAEALLRNEVSDWIRNSLCEPWRSWVQHPFK